MACLFKDRRSGIWQAKYYVNGKPKYRSLKTRREDHARKRLEKLEHSLEDTGSPDRSHTPLKAFLGVYQRHLKTKRGRFWRGPASAKAAAEAAEPPDRLRKGTKNEISRLNIFTNWLEGQHPEVRTLEAVTAPMIAQFLATKQQGGRKPKTINHYRTMLHTMFNFAVKMSGYISSDRRFPNPVAAIERASEPWPEIQYLEREQIEEQFAAIDKIGQEYKTTMEKTLAKSTCNPKTAEHIRELRALMAKLNQARVMIGVYIYAGLRREEALWLTPRDVNLGTRMIIIRAKTVGTEYWQPKTGKNRAVPISRALSGLLHNYTPPNGAKWFFPAPEGNRWDPDNWSHFLKDINKQAGLPWTCWEYRHTFGSHLAQKGESLYKISELMGNSPDICRKHYAHLIPERLRDTVEFGFEGSLSEGTHGAPRAVTPQLPVRAQA